MNEPLIYVISGEKSREESRGKVEKKSGENSQENSQEKNLKAKKKSGKEKSSTKICMALTGLRKKDTLFDRLKKKWYTLLKTQDSRP